MPSWSLSMRWARNSLAACWFFENFQHHPDVRRGHADPLAARPRRLDGEERVLEDGGVRVLGRAVRRDGVVDPARDARGEEPVVGRVVPGEDLRRHALVEQRLGEAERLAQSPSSRSWTFSPDGSVSVPPKLNNIERQMRFASAHWENAMPVGWPLGLSVRAATRASSHVSGRLQVVRVEQVLPVEHRQQDVEDRDAVRCGPRPRRAISPRGSSPRTSCRRRRRRP